MSANICPQCGAQVEGGLTGCQAVWETFSFQALEQPRLAALQTLTFDSYCMQHVERYGVSAKSYAAHLTRLCIGVEYGGETRLYAALGRWFHGGLVKPPVLVERGRIHISDVMTQPDIEAQVALIHAWAVDVWVAYAAQQALARQWLNEALILR